MDNHCKRCGSKDIATMTNEEYENEGKISLISGYKCVNCECLHCIEDDYIIWWEYAVNSLKDSNAPANYAQSHN